jgi:hypothetical protein
VENAELRQKIEDKLLEHLGVTTPAFIPAAEEPVEDEEM